MILLVFPTTLWATLPVTAVWEINTSGPSGNTGGGGFNPSRTMTNNDLACSNANTATPTCTSAGDAFIAADDEGWLFIQSGGTYTPLIFCRISDVTGGTATIDAAAGACNVISSSVQGGWTTNSSAGIASTASPTGGVWGIDLSRGTSIVFQSTTASYTTATSLVTAGSLTYRPAYLGNILQVVAGTGATQAWYEITGAAAGTSYTLDRDAGGGSDRTNMSINIGGAISLGSSTANRTDDIFFEQAAGANGTGAMVFWIKAGTYSTAAIAVSASCASRTPCVISGYSTVRGDNPTGSSRPTIAGGGNTLGFGDTKDLRNLNVTTTAAAGLSLGVSAKAINVKVVNSSTTADRVALTMAATGYAERVELSSYAGTAWSSSTNAVALYDSYIHDSKNCLISSSTTATITIVNTIFAGCNTIAASFTGALTGRAQIAGNTFYGGESKFGVGVDFVAGTTNPGLTGNIFYGLTTGVNHADTGQTSGYDNCNAFNNNTTNGTNWPLGSRTVTTAPAFANVAEVVVTTATTSNTGNTLTKSGATFVTSGVTAGRDLVYISSGGAGATVKVYSISSVDSETQLTLGQAPGNSTGDVTAKIRTGHNFMPTGSLTSTCIGDFPGALTTGYQTIGAVQQQPGGGNDIIGQ